MCPFAPSTSSSRRLARPFHTLPRQGMQEPLEVSLPTADFKVKIVLTVPQGGSRFGAVWCVRRVRLGQCMHGASDEGKAVDDATKESQFDPLHARITSTSVCSVWDRPLERLRICQSWASTDSQVRSSTTPPHKTLPSALHAKAGPETRA
jgi:hypothetical protein